MEINIVRHTHLTQVISLSPNCDNGCVVVAQSHKRVQESYQMPLELIMLFITAQLHPWESLSAQWTDPNFRCGMWTQAECSQRKKTKNKSTTISSSRLRKSDWHGLVFMIRYIFKDRNQRRVSQSSSNWQSRCGVITEQKYRSGRNTKGTVKSYWLLKDQRVL